MPETRLPDRPHTPTLSTPAAVPTPATTPTPANTEPKKPWLWNVVLHDDSDHTYDYVIRMMQSLFGHDFESAYRVARSVDNDGRAVCCTTHKELAELRLEQIHAFGRDPLMSACKGPMSAHIEPAGNA
ncbi:MAG: ATP-dependent Clp protease adaptor ClpS [Phycisphaerae bacterium]|nr:ATP-dependent Clp protease adaptor ClpS [Phycisphaerae bacterium]